MEVHLSKKYITVNEVTGFDLNFKVDGDEQIEVKNLYGYSAKDVPDIGSGKTLKGTTCFYVVFQYGDDADSIATKSDSDDIEAKCNDENWTVTSKTNRTYGKYWKVAAANTHIIGGGRANSMEHIVTFTSIKCNSQIGRTVITLKGLSLAGICGDTNPAIEKVPQPNLSNLKIMSSGPFNFGDTLQLSWDVDDCTSFTILLDGNTVAQLYDHYETGPLPVKYEPYVVDVINKAGSRLQQKVSCEISAILDFEVVKIDKDSVTFKWEADENNVMECSIATIATNIALKGQDTFERSITSDQTFRFLANLIDGRNTVMKEIKYFCPVIESFSAVTSESDKVKNCRKMLKGKVKDGFLSADYLLTHLEDDEVFFPCHLTCKGGGGGGTTTYLHKYTWSGKNVDKYYFVMDTGEKSQEYESDVQKGEITTESENGGATLYAVGKYDYEVSKHT